MIHAPGGEGDRGKGRGVEKVQVVWVLVKIVPFILSKAVSHCRALDREVTRFDLHFQVTLVLNWVKGRSRERNGKANTADWWNMMGFGDLSLRQLDVSRCWEHNF